MSLITAFIVTSALLTPVYWLASGAKAAEMRVSAYFNTNTRNR